MADGGGGGKGKILAGCGCISMVLFFSLSMFIQFGIAAVASAVPDLAEVLTVIAQFGSFVTGPCCCLSGVAFIIGIVLTVTGNKKSEG